MQDDRDSTSSRARTFPASPSTPIAGPSHAVDPPSRSSFGTASSRRTTTILPPKRSLRGVTSRLFRASENGAAASVPREWTLFAQRYENEGQIPSSVPRSGIQRAVSHSSSLSALRPNETNQARPFTVAIPQSSSASSFLGSNQPEVQSPVEDFSLPDPPALEPSPFPADHPLNGDASGHTNKADETSASRAADLWAWVQKTATLSSVQKNILKCSIAYFLGSLFTFNPFLSGLIESLTSRRAVSAHMVATVAVYFNPAKTAGGMVEADTYCLMGLLFAAFVSLTSMSGFWWFEVQPGYEWLADTIVIFWVGLSMSIVAWMKVWMAKPTFNPACSLCAIILFTVVVKEGGLAVLTQVSVLVLFGALISNLVCYVLWPQSATHHLRSDMKTTLDSFATLLALITDTFLLEAPPAPPNQERIARAVAAHQASFTKLTKDLSEAHSEAALFGGPRRPRAGADARHDLGRAYEDTIGSLHRLGQHLNGLRSGTRLQYELTQAGLDGRVVLPHQPASKQPPTAPGNVHETQCEQPDEEEALLQAAANMFGELVDDLGSPLKALSGVCQSSLEELSRALSVKSSTFRPHFFERLIEEIDRTMFEFESTSNHAVLRLYKKAIVPPEGQADSHTMSTSLSGHFENQVVSQTQNENLFLVYFFIFTLQEFARELDSLVDATGRICLLEQAARMRGSIFTRAARWVGDRFRSQRMDEDSSSIRRRPSARPLKRPISTYFLPERKPRKSFWFPKVKPHAPDTMQTPARKDLPRWGRVKQALWALGSRLREHDFKYAFKAGMATALLAAPAWFDATRPVFLEYRGEWALISFFVVMSPTIGATNSLGLHRVFWSIFGAATAAGIYTLFPENAIVLSIFGFLFSIPCFYYIVALPQYATSGRFVLLTYNLTCLYVFNAREKDLAVLDVAFKRSVAVAVGVAWAFVVSRVWWPSEARRELSKGLGEFCQNIGWLYIRLVAHNTLAAKVDSDEDQETPTEDSPLIMGVHHEKQHSIHEFMAMELHLQIQLIKLQELLAQTQHEPRLKGPFPVKLYRGILTGLQTILDRLHSMRCVTMRDEWHTDVRRDYILPVNKQRRDMVGNIILYLSIVSAAFQLKAPLPPYLPPVEQSRLKLVDAIKALDTVRYGEVKGSKQLLFFSWAMSMKGVTQELETLGKTLQHAFGVIGQNQFDALWDETSSNAT